MQKLVIETTTSKKESSRDVIPFGTIKAMRARTNEFDHKSLAVYLDGGTALIFNDKESKFNIVDWMGNGTQNRKEVTIGEVIDEFLAYEEVGK